MPSNSSALRTFVRSYFKATWEIELLMTLRKECSSGCTPDQLSKRLSINTVAIRHCLNRFLQDGLVCRGARDAYSLAPNTTEKRLLVEQLAEAYLSRRLALFRELYA